jgi:hypothetical protein
MGPFRHRIIVVLAFIICGYSSNSIYAQQRDAGLWTSISLDVKVTQKLTAGVSQEFRFNENVSELGTYFTDAGLGYKISKNLQVAANYRFIQKRRVDDSYSPRHRFYLDVKFRKKIKPFNFQLRSRLQDQYADIGRAADGGIAEYYSRNKFSLEWDNRKSFKPFVSVELFSPLNYPREYAFDNMRYVAGIELAYSKHHNFEFFYMIQKEFHAANPVTDYIAGVGYLFKL